MNKITELSQQEITTVSGSSSQILFIMVGSILTIKLCRQIENGLVDAKEQFNSIIGFGKKVKEKFDNTLKYGKCVITETKNGQNVTTSLKNCW